jgi:hypothetical protein
LLVTWQFDIQYLQKVLEQTLEMVAAHQVSVAAVALVELEVVGSFLAAFVEPVAKEFENLGSVPVDWIHSFSSVEVLAVVAVVVASTVAL